MKEFRQWTLNETVGADSFPAMGTTVRPVTNGSDDWITRTFPYSVPPNKFLGIYSVVFASKSLAWDGGNRRSSYFCVDNIGTFPEHLPAIAGSKPLFVIPGGLDGKQFSGAIINNSPEPQNMTIIISGILSDTIGELI